jgi:hypothetical protein
MIVVCKRSVHLSVLAMSRPPTSMRSSAA